MSFDTAMRGTMFAPFSLWAAKLGAPARRRRSRPVKSPGGTIMHRTTTNDTLCFLAGAGLGAGLMYLFDPQVGRRRRGLVRDKAVSAWHETQDGLQAVGTDMSNRFSGVMAETRSLFRDEPVDDLRLHDRIRTALGRAISHPRAIDVMV